MARMTIGEFATAAGLTPKALRLYDELGLVTPAAVDPASGYRSYVVGTLLEQVRAAGAPDNAACVVVDLVAP